MVPDSSISSRIFSWVSFSTGNRTSGIKFVPQFVFFVFFNCPVTYLTQLLRNSLQVSLELLLGFLFVCLFLLGLRCYTQAFSSCSVQGLLSSCCAWASHCASFSCGAWALGLASFNSCGERAPGHMGSVVSSQTRVRTCVSCIGRQILNHWTTREVPFSLIFCTWHLTLTQFPGSFSQFLHCGNVLICGFLLSRLWFYHIVMQDLWSSYFLWNTLWCFEIT